MARVKPRTYEEVVIPNASEDCDRLRRVIDHIAESVIVSVVTAGTMQEVTWGCGICEGASLGYDRPDGRGEYAHRDWCPRK